MILSHLNMLENIVNNIKDYIDDKVYRMISNLDKKAQRMPFLEDMMLMCYLNLKRDLSEVDDLLNEDKISELKRKVSIRGYNNVFESEYDSVYDLDVGLLIINKLDFRHSFIFQYDGILPNIYLDCDNNRENKLSSCVASNITGLFSIIDWMKERGQFVVPIDLNSYKSKVRPIIKSLILCCDSSTQQKYLGETK